MKRYISLFILSSIALPVFLYGQEAGGTASDSLHLGYGINADRATASFSVQGVGRDVVEKSPYIDVSKSLYGRIAGLNVYQGMGPTSSNISALSVHGQAPLVLVDGFPRDIKDITALEIESVEVMKDAVASALYGVRGANGVVMITTRGGKDGKLKVSADYHYGLGLQSRSPEFADSYTYANSLNTALALDGLDARYSSYELDAFRTGEYPYEFPNVDWWNEVYKKTTSNHRLGLTFEGGSDRFKYYSVIDYMYDIGLFRNRTNTDSRYSTMPSDVRLNLRANLDVKITRTTFMKLHVTGKLAEDNAANSGDIYSTLYKTPSAAFPVMHEDGIFGGSAIYGANNPFALLNASGNTRTTVGMLLLDMSLRQKLDVVTEGLAVEALLSFDNCGVMYDSSSQQYRYKDAGASILPDGTLTSTPVIYGRDSETLGHSQGFESLYIRNSFQAKVDYARSFGAHDVSAAAIYDQQSYVLNGRNTSSKRQSAIVTASYVYGRRYSLGLAGSWSGTAYLPKGSRFNFYPAVNAAWIATGEDFLKDVKSLDYWKIYASAGLSGWDGNMSHELWRQSYGSGGSYYLTTNASPYWGHAEGTLPVENLKPEMSRKITLGTELKAFDDRLGVYVEGFWDRRSNILVPASSAVSGIIGIGTSYECSGENNYRGLDASISWNDRHGDFTYGLYGNMSYLETEVINENQEFQEYDYLYHAGNPVGQKYGLEVIGFFHDQREINNSPSQTFSTVRPGDLKYKDQNGDNIIDSKDMVRMYGSNIPRLYFGFGIDFGYKGFEVSADFQGMTGVTVSLLDSPLYSPLLNNGNISRTFLDTEIPWTPEDAAKATMPRLTTQTNNNNYRGNSLWYRDGSFLKLRNLTLSYTFSRKMLKFADMKVYVQGTNLFSLDNLKVVDPEQLTASYPTMRVFWAGVKFNF